MTDCNKTFTYTMAKTFKDNSGPGSDSLFTYSDTEIRKLDNAMKTYLEDCNRCKTETQNSPDCQEAASTKLSRAMPYAYKNIYPWRNYDWNYSNFIDNNYSTLATGATKTGSLDAMKKNFAAFRKLVGAYVEDPNPSPKSIAGGKTKNDDYPYYECTDGIKDMDGYLLNTPNETKRCRITHDIKYKKLETPPTTDDFLKGNDKISGEKASSYFVRVGNCPRPDIKTQSACESKGYFWTPPNEDSSGNCEQPRYAYMDNTPGFKIGGKRIQGLVPSIAKDFLSLTPDKILAVAMGSNIDGVFQLQPCPIVNEEFNNPNNSINSINSINSNKSYQIDLPEPLNDLTIQRPPRSIRREKRRIMASNYLKTKGINLSSEGIKILVFTLALLITLGVSLYYYK
jgi:hypothetical protein